MKSTVYVAIALTIPFAWGCHPGNPLPEANNPNTSQNATTNREEPLPGKINNAPVATNPTQEIPAPQQGGTNLPVIDSAVFIRNVLRKDPEKSQTVRDAQNNPTKTDFPDGSSLIYKQGRPFRFVDTNAQQTSYEFDSHGNHLRTVRPDGTIEVK